MRWMIISLRLCLILLCTFSEIYAQVGINTTTPRKALEVAGNVKISESIIISKVNSLDDNSKSTFLIQDENNDIKAMDVSNPVGSALGYIQEYLVVNPNLDWILDFDTRVNATEYVLNVISANYNRELIMTPSRSAQSSIPYTSAFIKDGTWHIIADYPVASNKNPDEVGTWTLTTLIYSKDLSKQLGSVEILMDDKSEGTAINPIIN